MKCVSESTRFTGDVVESFIVGEKVSKSGYAHEIVVDSLDILMRKL